MLVYSSFGSRPSGLLGLWVRPEQLAIAVFALAFITMICAEASGAGRIILALTPVGQPGTEKLLHFGYLYELNALPFYMVVFPVCAMVLGLSFKSFDEAIATDVENGNLVGGRSDVYTWLHERGAGQFAPRTLGCIFLCFMLFSVNAEFIGLFSGFVGDREKLAFGYIQAPHIHEYEGKTLTDLVTGGRTIMTLRGTLDTAAFSQVAVHVKAGGTSGTWATAWYWSFVVVAIILHSFVLTYLVWAAARVVWCMRTTSELLTNDVGKPRYNIGAISAERPWKGLAALIHYTAYAGLGLFLGGVGLAFAVSANQAKGTCKVFSGISSAMFDIGYLQQVFVAALPVVTILLCGMRAIVIAYRIIMNANSSIYSQLVGSWRDFVVVVVPVCATAFPLAISRVLWNVYVQDTEYCELQQYWINGTDALLGAWVRFVHGG